MCDIHNPTIIKNNADEFCDSWAALGHLKQLHIGNKFIDWLPIGRRSPCEGQLSLDAPLRLDKY
jgi:hypothetical protein